MPTDAVDLDLVDGLVQLSFAVQSVLAKAAAGHDLTVPQVRLLGILRDREPGMLQLAKYLGLDKSSVTGLIDRAERRGLVRRSSTAVDGRSVLVSATPLGRGLTEQVSVTISAEIRGLSESLTAAEETVLATLISRIINAAPGGPLPTR